MSFAVVAARELSYITVAVRHSASPNLQAPRSALRLLLAARRRREGAGAAAATSLRVGALWGACVYLLHAVCGAPYVIRALWVGVCGHLGTWRALHSNTLIHSLIHYTTLSHTLPSYSPSYAFSHTLSSLHLFPFSRFL